MNDDTTLDALFRRYRDACPDIEAGPQFMPVLWQKIESRQNFWSVFERFGGRVAAASAALCLLLLVLSWVAAPTARTLAPTYADALMADHTAERTYYAEAIRSTPADESQAPPRTAPR